jgi:hypothetical protein
MGNLRIGHMVEAGLWLSLCLFLYIYSFEFDQPIEIYKFGASAWPRTIILLIAIAAVGQLYHHWKKGDETDSDMISSAVDDGLNDDDSETDHNSLRWYVSTFAILTIPFIYMRVPDWIAGMMEAEGTTLHILRLIFAAILIGVFIVAMQRNRLGAMLALPLFFATMLEDIGFYSLAPLFIIGVMFLMGERRIKPMLMIMALIYSLLMALFVKVLFVGLPLGNVHPFYDIGSWIVTVLQ